MGFASILLLAVGLSMDAMAVSAARGLALERVRLRHVLLVSGLFGGFQALMPLLGFLLGKGVGGFIAAWDHWVVLLLLGGIGGKMLWEAFEPPGDEPAPDAHSERNAFDVKVMLALAIATSIDALAAGFTLPLLKAPLGVSLLTIGVTTALLSALGLFAGHRFGGALGRRLDALGGLVLIGLGLKALLERLLGG